MSCFVDDGLSIHGVTDEFGVIGAEFTVLINIAISSGSGNTLVEFTENWGALELHYLVNPSNNKTVTDIPL